VTAQLRENLGKAALLLATAAGYQGAGTAEFLLDNSGNYYFLEVNARLQVEHPVTELITGRDLVADQLKIAAGDPLEIDQSSIRFDGHAIEARLYAEDPNAGFLPATGEVIQVQWPKLDGVRVDAGIGAGDVVGTRYDPLLAKIIAHGANRDEALNRLRSALGETSVLGVTTNVGFLRWLLVEPDIQAGHLYTDLIDERWHGEDALPPDAWQRTAASIAHHAPSDVAPRLGFRLNAPPRVRIEIGEEEQSVELEPTLALGRPSTGLADGSVVVDLDGRAVVARLAPAPTVESAARHASHEGATSARVQAPMPGTVIAVRVAEGDIVEPGQVLVLLEAMKMENAVPAPAAGRVVAVNVQPGQQVQRAETLVELA
jgi:acetyl/propionyl-CoA carboxylase alpha subunit